MSSEEYESEDRHEEPYDMDVADDEEIESIADAVVGNRYRDTRREEEFTVTEADTVTSTVEGHQMEASCLFFDWESGSTGHQNVDDFQTLLTAGIYEEVDA